jgi:predicted PurR-regulated permease PerM
MDYNRKVTVNISNKTIVRTLLWIAAAIILYKFIGQVAHVLTLIFAAFFLALALNPIVSWSRDKLSIKSRVRATSVAYLMVITFLIVFFALVLPPLVKQTREFIRTVPASVQNFQSQDTGLSRTVSRYHLDEKLTEGARQFASHYGNFGNTVLDTGRRIAETVASIFAVIVLAFMMLVEGPRWFDLYFGMLAEKQRNRQRRLAQRMYRAVTGFVNGQVILAFVAGTFAFLALEIAGQVLNVSTNAAALAGIVAVFGIRTILSSHIYSLSSMNLLQ